MPGREVLRAALMLLAPRQRAVVVLRYYEDLTERETAAALGISVGTVKSQARDALARLRVLVPDAQAEAHVVTLTGSQHLAQNGRMAKRQIRQRARTLLTIDETVERVDVTAQEMAVLLDRFSTALDNFTIALDRFSDAAERIDHIAERLDPVLATMGAVTSPVTMARSAARKVRRAPASPAVSADPEELTYPVNPT